MGIENKAFFLIFCQADSCFELGEMVEQNISGKAALGFCPYSCHN
jgi:hypothetical protein